MTYEQEKELNRIKREMEVYDKAISVFDINKHRFSSNSDKDKAKENIKKHRFGYFLECFKKNDKNHMRLNPKGFFGGDSVEVDSEFVDMCLGYFKKKRKLLDDEYAKL